MVYEKLSTTIMREWKREANVFDHLPVGLCAFACLTVLNNYELWIERSKNEQDTGHSCHKSKCGLDTRQQARGSGGRNTFMSGWDKEGVKAHNCLMVFFSKMRKHEESEELVKACGNWLPTNISLRTEVEKGI